MLEPLLEEIDHLLLAGDVWQQCKVGPGRDEALRKYERLLTLVQGKGLTIEVLRGNHDPGEGPGVAWLADRAILVTHGDAVYADATPWSREFPRCRPEVDEIIARYAPLDHLPEACADRAREIALVLKVHPLPKLPPPLNYFATALWPPGRAFQMLRVWRELGDEAHRFLGRVGGGAPVLVCGHFHRPGIWEREGRLVLNTGAFMRGCQAWAVDCNEEGVTARLLELRNSRFEPGEVMGRWMIGGRRGMGSENSDGGGEREAGGLVGTNEVASDF